MEGFGSARWISGNELKTLLEEQVQAFTQGTIKDLSRLYGPQTLVKLQHITRCIEDLINVEVAALTRPDLERSFDLDIGPGNAIFLATVGRHFDQAVVARIEELLSHIRLFRRVLVDHQGDWDGRLSNLRTYADLAHYFKSRRRHLNTLFYTLSDVARGPARVSQPELYERVFTTIDHSLVSGLTSLHQKLTMLSVFPDYRCLHTGEGLLDEDPRGARLLDGQYLEAERMAITELELAPPSGSFDSRKITSADELRAQLDQIEVAYAPYGLSERGFSDLHRFIREILVFVKDDYHLRVPKDAFLDIATRYKDAPWRAHLVYRPHAQYPLHGSHAAFAEHDGTFYSDLMLLMRFAYRIRAHVLERNRRFQIKSGFIFENTVKQQLSTMGFENLDIKRINRKEFDVVAKKDHIVYNFQCKNVLLDHELMETDLAQFVRHNQRIVRYFQRALRKEVGREGLLRTATGAQDIKHYVISQFPVFTDDPHILAMRDLSNTFA